MSEQPSTDEHTPGPWLINPDAYRHEPGFYGTPPDESEPGTEEVYTAIHVGKSVQLTGFIRPQDARLIAAAPDLLAAANAILSHFMPDFPDSRAVDDCLVQLAAAIAKAEK